MAKVAFTKLGLTKNTEIKNFTWKDQEVEVKQYLPISDKLELITNVINQAQDNNNFMNPAKVQIFTELEMIFKYTNINFTEKQKEDILKLYDLLIGSGFMKKFYENMDENEKEQLIGWVLESCENVYTYRNSVYGILDAMGTDYSNLELDASKIAEDIGNPEVLTTIKDVLSKMG